jgi:hypothetical protein
VAVRLAGPVLIEAPWALPYPVRAALTAVAYWEGSSTVARSVFDRLKERGEEVWGQISNDLMENPHFIKAMQGAIKGKEKLEEGVTQALRGMNIPTRTEFKKALSKIEMLERELAVQKAAVEGLAVKAAKATPAPRKAKASAPKPRAAKAKPKAGGSGA